MKHPGWRGLNVRWPCLLVAFVTNEWTTLGPNTFEGIKCGNVRQMHDTRRMDSFKISIEAGFIGIEPYPRGSGLGVPSFNRWMVFDHRSWYILYFPWVAHAGDKHKGY
jgi:hypothetical protein